MDHDPNAEHFSEARWADYARAVGDADLRREVHAHLAAGCGQCQAIADRLRAVCKLAAGERTWQIPQELVDRAKRIADLAPTASGWESLKAIAVQLVQSSSLDWQPPGVRSLGEAAVALGERLLFRADDYSVYLKIEPLLGGEAAEIVGEIVNERERGELLEGIPVQMVSRGRTLSETATNRFGEFLIEYPVRKNVTLRLALKHRGQRIDLPMGGLQGERAGDRE